VSALPAVVAPEAPGEVATPESLGLRGIEKVATLLVSLGPEAAAEVLQHMTADDIERISLHMAKMRTVSAEATEAVFTELVSTADAMDLYAEGGVDYAREVLERTLGAEKAAEVIGRLSAQIERRPFESLRKTPPEQILAFLGNEAPQTIALVLANLHTTLAAQVLCEFEPDRQADIAQRVAAMTETSPEVIQVVERIIKQKLSAVMVQEYASVGGVAAVAEILNHTDRPTERNVLDRISESDPNLAEEIRMLLFTFEDVVKLDDRSIQLVLREVDQKDLALALRGVPGEVKAKVLSNLSARGAQMLEEEMEFQPPQRRRVVEEAQGRIVAVIRRLEQAGEVVLGRSGGGGDDEVV
jgi:flagellar motor switch protein FliG